MRPRKGQPLLQRRLREPGRISLTGKGMFPKTWSLPSVVGWGLSTAARDLAQPGSFRTPVGLRQNLGGPEKIFLPKLIFLLTRQF